MVKIFCMSIESQWLLNPLRPYIIVPRVLPSRPEDSRFMNWSDIVLQYIQFWLYCTSTSEENDHSWKYDPMSDIQVFVKIWFHLLVCLSSYEYAHQK